METKRAKVIMLPTKDNTGIFKDIGNSLFYAPKYYKDGKYQHLYITTNDEIKEGDWYVIVQYKSKGYQVSTQPCRKEEVELQDKSDCKKIIATTDKSLRIESKYEDNEGRTHYDNSPLPEPSKAFIKKYVEEYNKGNQIVEVDVEYIVIAPDCESYQCNHQLDPVEYTCDNEECQDSIDCIKLGLYPKIDKHNTITIHPIKDSWSREEIEELLSYATHKRSCDQSAFGYHQRPCNCGLDKWIEENL